MAKIKSCLKVGNYRKVDFRHIQHYGRLAIKRAHISVPIIPSKLLGLTSGLSAGWSSFEGIIGTEICAGFMASLRDFRLWNFTFSANFRPLYKSLLYEFFYMFKLSTSWAYTILTEEFFDVLLTYIYSPNSANHINLGESSFTHTLQKKWGLCLMKWTSKSENTSKFAIF